MQRGRRGGVAAVQSSCSFIYPARVCGWKRLCVANNGIKGIPCWNQEVQYAIRAKKACKARHQTTVKISLHLRCAQAHISAALTVEMPQIQSWENFGDRTHTRFHLLAIKQSVLANHTASPWNKI